MDGWLGSVEAIFHLKQSKLFQTVYPLTNYTAKNIFFAITLPSWVPISFCEALALAPTSQSWAELALFSIKRAARPPHSLRNRPPDT